MRLRSDDYLLFFYNIQDKEFIPLPRTQSISIDTDFKTTVVMQVASDGSVNISSEDHPVTALSIVLNPTIESPFKNGTILSWLATIAGEKSIAHHREDFFSVGKATYFYPENNSLLTVKDFDVGITQGGTRIDGWVVVRDYSLRNIARIHSLINAQVSNLDIEFSVDGNATATITLETDGVSTYLKNLTNCTIAHKYVDPVAESTQQIIIDDFDDIYAVWVNYRLVKKGWATYSSNTLDFTYQGGYTIYNGDIIRYIYVPLGWKASYEYYQNLIPEIKRDIIQKSHIVPYLLTDTNLNRVVHGLFPSRRDSDLEVIVNDGTNDVIWLKYGIVWIDGAYYKVGYTEGEIDSVSVANDVTTIIDNSFLESTTDFWKSATLTMITGGASGETLEVSGYTTGSFELAGTFSVTPSQFDEFVLNAKKVTSSDPTHDAIYISANSGVTTLATGETASPPTNSVKLADITVSGTDITSYTDSRVFQREALERVQTLAYSIPLEREEITELGYESVLDRSLTIPLEITSTFTVKDIDSEIVRIMVNDSDYMMDPTDSYRDTLGIQVVAYKNKPSTADKPYKESDVCLVIETTDAIPSSDSSGISVGSTGESSFSLVSDNIRFMAIV